MQESLRILQQVGLLEKERESLYAVFFDTLLVTFRCSVLVLYYDNDVNQDKGK